MSSKTVIEKCRYIDDHHIENQIVAPQVKISAILKSQETLNNKMSECKAEVVNKIK